MDVPNIVYSVNSVRLEEDPITNIQTKLFDTQFLEHRRKATGKKTADRDQKTRYYSAQ